MTLENPIAKNMSPVESRLHDLPLEIFCLIMESIVRLVTINEVHRICTVCKLFDRELIRVLISSRLIENTIAEHRAHEMNDGIIARYIVERVLTEPRTEVGWIGRLNLVLKFTQENTTSALDHALPILGKDQAKFEMPSAVLHSYLRRLALASVHYFRSCTKSQMANLSTAAAQNVLPDSLSAALILRLPCLPAGPDLHYKEIIDPLQFCLLDTPLVYAVQLADTQLVKRLLTQKKRLWTNSELSVWWNTTLPRTRDNDVLRALCSAARRGLVDIIRMLISDDYGCPTEGATYNKLIQSAVQGGHIPSLRLLRHHGGLWHNSPLQSFILAEAARHGHLRIGEMALLHGADAMKELSDDDPGGSLAIAAKYGRTDFVRLFLTSGADLSALTGRRNNLVLTAALSAAAYEGHADVMQLLVAEAEEQQIPWDSSNTWWAAAVQGHTEIIQLLLELGGNPNKRPGGAIEPLQLLWSDSALIAACINGHYQVVELLLGSGIDLEGRFKEEAISGVLAAVAKGHTLIAQLLLAKGVQINETHIKYNPVWMLTSGDRNQHLIRRDLEELGIILPTSDIWGQHQPQA